MPPLLRAIIDTNVVFEGLTKQGSACGLVIDAWRAGLFQSCISNALAYAYVDVLGRKLSPQRWQQLQPVLGSLLVQAEFVTIYYSWRPSTPDPSHEHLVDCAMNAGAVLVTYNERDFRVAKQSLGLNVLRPVEFLTALVQQK